MHKLLALLVIAFAATLPSFGADPAPLRVGVTANMPPVVFKEGKQIVGIEADFAKVLGEKLGRPIKFVEVKWEDQIPALTEGRTDIIMSSLSITRPRQLRVAFCTPYLTIGQMTLVRREDSGNYLLGFPTKPPGTIGVLKATTGDYLVQQEFLKNPRKEFQTAPQAAEALMKKRIDLFICDLPVIWWMASIHEADGLVVVPIPLSEEQLAWAVRRTDTELLSAVNNVLEQLRASGQATAIVKRWLPFFK
jgi:ABC-type amino acid transport substrate-binding protein